MVDKFNILNQTRSFKFIFNNKYKKENNVFSINLYFDFNLKDFILVEFVKDQAIKYPYKYCTCQAIFANYFSDIIGIMNLNNRDNLYTKNDYLDNNKFYFVLFDCINNSVQIKLKPDFNVFNFYIKSNDTNQYINKKNYILMFTRLKQKRYTQKTASDNNLINNLDSYLHNIMYKNCSNQTFFNVKYNDNLFLHFNYNKIFINNIQYNKVLKYSFKDKKFKLCIIFVKEYGIYINKSDLLYKELFKGKSLNDLLISDTDNSSYFKKEDFNKLLDYIKYDMTEYELVLYNNIYSAEIKSNYLGKSKCLEILLKNQIINNNNKEVALKYKSENNDKSKAYIFSNYNTNIVKNLLSKNRNVKVLNFKQNKNESKDRNNKNTIVKTRAEFYFDVKSKNTDLKLSNLKKLDILNKKQLNYIYQNILDNIYYSIQYFFQNKNIYYLDTLIKSVNNNLKINSINVIDCLFYNTKMFVFNSFIDKLESSKYIRDNIALLIIKLFYYTFNYKLLVIYKIEIHNNKYIFKDNNIIVHIKKCYLNLKYSIDILLNLLDLNVTEINKFKTKIIALQEEFNININPVYNKIDFNKNTNDFNSSNLKTLIYKLNKNILNFVIDNLFNEFHYLLYYIPRHIFNKVLFTIFINCFEVKISDFISFYNLKTRYINILDSRYKVDNKRYLNSKSILDVKNNMYFDLRYTHDKIRRNSEDLK